MKIGFLVVPLLLGLAAPAAAEDPVTFSALAVNGQRITADRVRAEMKTALGSTKALHSGTNIARSPDKQLLGQVVDRLVVRELLAQEARARGLSVTEEEICKAWEAEQKRWGSKEKFEKSCQLRAITPDFLKDRITEDLLVRKYLKQEAAPAATEAQQRAYYERHAASFHGKAAPVLRFVSLSFGKQRGEERAEARFQELMARMRKGETFESLAKAYSDHPSAAAGGAIGEEPATAVPFLEEGRRLRPRQFTNRLADAEGIYVFFRDAPTPPPFEEVRDEVGKAANAELQERRVAAIVEGLKAKAKIEYLP